MNDSLKFNCTKCGQPIEIAADKFDLPVSCPSCSYFSVPPKDSRQEAAYSPAVSASLQGIMLDKQRDDFGGFWIRVGAYFVDMAVMLLPTLLARFLFHAVTPINTQAEQLVVNLGDMFISILAWWVYTAAFLSSSWQATVGKRVCGLKVIDYDGRRITFGRASGRYFGSILSAILLVIGYLMIGWSRRKQGLHDILAETLVLKATS